MSDYTNSGQQNLIRVVNLLSLNPLQATSISELEKKIPDMKRDQIFRAMKNLAEAGWAEETPSGYRLTPYLTQLSERVRVAINDTHHLYLSPQSITQ